MCMQFKEHTHTHARRHFDNSNEKIIYMAQQLGNARNVAFAFIPRIVRDTKKLSFNETFFSLGRLAFFLMFRGYCISNVTAPKCRAIYEIVILWCNSQINHYSSA